MTTAGSSSATRTLAVSAAGTLLVVAVFSALVTTIADCSRELHAGVSAVTWALSGMSLGLATALLAAGAVTDAAGPRRVLAWSAGLLGAASVVAALAPSMDVLVAARVLQGVAGGGVLAAGLAAIGHAFPAGPARARATSIWGASVGAGIAIGPLAGAALAAGLGWRSGFWVEAAAAGAVSAAAATLRDSRATTRFAPDLPGIVTLGAGMALLTAAFVEARH